MPYIRFAQVPKKVIHSYHFPGPTSALGEK